MAIFSDAWVRGLDSPLSHEPPVGVPLERVAVGDALYYSPFETGAEAYRRDRHEDVIVGMVEAGLSLDGLVRAAEVCGVARTTSGRASRLLEWILRRRILVLEEDRSPREPLTMGPLSERSPVED